MKGEWCYFKSYVDKQTCERIINDVQVLPVQDARIGDQHGAGNISSNVRRTKIRFIQVADQRFSYIFDILWKTAISANDDFFQFNISRLTYLQFAEYNANELAEYKAHHDVFWMNGDPVYHRKLSAVIQLSPEDSYTGGEFEIVDSGVKHRPPADDVRKQGTILYMPSFLLHQVKPVTSGIRYSLVAWFDGKKWT